VSKCDDREDVCTLGLSTIGTEHRCYETTNIRKKRGNRDNEFRNSQKPLFKEQRELLCERAIISNGVINFYFLGI
jgi:hypothetical protein